MRTVPAGVTSALTKERIVNARATFRKLSLDFDEQTIANILAVDAFDTEGSTTYDFTTYSRDSSDYGNGFIRVGEVRYSGYYGNPDGYRLAWQVVDDPESTWPKWQIESWHKLLCSNSDGCSCPIPCNKRKSCLVQQSGLGRYLLGGFDCRHLHLWW